MIEDIKVLKFGSLSIEYGEDTTPKLYTVGLNLGKYGDSSVIYIEYNGGKYLIDTGFCYETDTSPENLSFNKKYLKYIFDLHDLKFEDINGIFITHWHADHYGNLNLFPNAKLYSFFPKNPDKNDFLQNLIFNSRDRKLNIDTIARFYKFEELLPVITLHEDEQFAGCDIFPTPGHTSLHCSLLIKSWDLNIVVAGDAIVSQSYYDHKKTWQYNSGNLGVEACEKAMDKIISIADYIIPGHGHPFQNYRMNKIQKE
jgi:glyoxylase-like metal-dependent hydrolase (beta-lactamase superfamily II)